MITITISSTDLRKPTNNVSFPCDSRFCRTWYSGSGGIVDYGSRYRLVRFALLHNRPDSAELLGGVHLFCMCFHTYRIADGRSSFKLLGLLSPVNAVVPRASEPIELAFANAPFLREVAREFLTSLNSVSPHFPVV